MSKYALVEDGTVRNVVVWDGERALPFADRLVEVPDGERVKIGETTYDGTSFDTPPDPKPDPPDPDRPPTMSEKVDALIAALAGKGVVSEQEIDDAVRTRRRPNPSGDR